MFLDLGKNVMVNRRPDAVQGTGGKEVGPSIDTTRCWYTKNTALDMRY